MQRFLHPTYLCALLIAMLASATPPAAQRPNVLVVVLDDLGTDRLALYEDRAPCPPTPRLDQLRQRGVLFTNAYASPYCAPSRAMLQTGRCAFRTGFGHNIRAWDPWRLPTAEVFLSELLRDGFAPGAGYARAAFGKWHLAELTGHDTHPLEEGYELFAGRMGNADPATGHDHYHWRKVTAQNGAAQSTIVGSVHGPYTEATWSPSVNRRDAAQWIQAQTRPFFAYVAFGPPHRPLQVPPSTLLEIGTLRALALAGLRPGNRVGNADPPWKKRLVHDAMIEAVDTDLGLLLDQIPPSVLANTLVIVISDNGTESSMVSPPHATAHGKGSAYQIAIRVPLVVAGPQVLAPGTTCDALVSAVDIWRTVRDATGADESRVAPAGPLDSVSFLPLLAHPGGPGARRHVLSETFFPNGALSWPRPLANATWAVTDGRYKSVRDQGSDELYDLASDPDEKTNLLRTRALRPEELAALRDLRDYVRVLGAYNLP